MIGMIAAVSTNGVIGKNGSIPWRYKGDLQRFKRVTTGATIVMGRKTWESLGSKPLPNRTNIVISRQLANSEAYDALKMLAFHTIEDALGWNQEWEQHDVWFIGGAGIYEEAQKFCDVIDITYVPDVVEPDANVVSMPPFHQWFRFCKGPLLDHEDEPTLKRRIYTRLTGDMTW